MEHRMPLCMKHAQNCFCKLDCPNNALSNIDKASEWELFMLLKYSTACCL